MIHLVVSALRQRDDLAAVIATIATVAAFKATFAAFARPLAKKTTAQKEHTVEEEEETC